ncbi:hypothetical protein [Psychrobacillus antarcticus]|nr:hypothetical protein [Psychrobacillus antarcticus]
MDVFWEEKLHLAMKGTNMIKLTLTELKKELKQYDQKQLTQLVVDL